MVLVSHIGCTYKASGLLCYHVLGGDSADLEMGPDESGGICDGQSGNGAGFSPSSSVSLDQ